MRRREALLALALAGVTIAFMTFLPAEFIKNLDLSLWLLPARWTQSLWPALVAFGGLAAILAFVGRQRLSDSSESRSPSADR